MIRFRLHHKITLIFVVITGTLLAGVFFHLKRNIVDFSYQNIRKDLIRKAALARIFVEKSDPGADHDALAEQIASNLKLRVTLIDALGVVRGDSDFMKEDLPAMENHLERPEVQGALKSAQGESRRFSTSARREFLYIAMPYHTRDRQGIVRLAIPLDEIARISGRLNGILIAAFLVAFALSVLASYVALFLISRPVEKIAQGARRIAGGNFDNRIFVPGHDEISDLAAAFNDMAEQIRSRINEAAMGQSQLEAVFSSMTEGVLVLDGRGRIFLMNQALRRLLSIEGDPVGQRPLEVIRNADIQDMIADINADDGSGGVKEILFSVPEARVIRVQSAPVLRDGDELAGAVLVFHDITELRRLETIRKEFVANVSHELRTPAASIKGYAETLMDGALEDRDNAKDFVRIIAEEADRLARLIEDLLDLSAIESGRAAGKFSACRISAVLEKAVDSVRGMAALARVTVQCHGHGDAAVMGDELGLYRMFFNLVENAVKYNREGGRVDIDMDRTDGGITVRVRDTGIGIPAQDLPRIFERFYRVDKARSRRMGGTGLGLAIVKHIAQAHGGGVSVESVPDQGSVFTVVLPITDV